MAKMRIVVADDHALLRAGMAAMINAQPDLEVVAEAGTASDAVDAVLKTHADILTLDLTMPGGSSVKAIETLRTRSPSTKILVLTMHTESEYLRATLAAGAAGYLVKSAGDNELMAALRTIGQGRTIINVPLARDKVDHVFSGSAGKPESPGHANLSERELEVIKLLAKGHTNQSIADKMFLSVKTIETYRARIGTKLGLKSRADIVAYVTESGLLGPNELG